VAGTDDPTVEEQLMARPVELEVITGNELPTLISPWLDADGANVDLTGAAFMLRVADSEDPGTTLDEIDAGITGGDGTATLTQPVVLALGALNTSNSDTLRLKGWLTANPSGDPRTALLNITVLPAAQDIP
jgi:hypothetical protein